MIRVESNTSLKQSGRDKLPSILVLTKRRIYILFYKGSETRSEYILLKGANEVLKKYKPKILVECEARHVGRERVLETFQLLKGLGYKGSFIMDLSFISLDSFDFDIHQRIGAEFYCNNFIFE